MLDLGKPDEAEKLLDQALKADPHHMEATYNRGLLLWRDGKIPDDALVKQLEDVRSAHGAAWRAEYLLGLIHLERADAESAAEALERVGETPRGDADVDRALQTARSGIGNWRRCVRTWRVEHGGGVMSVAISPDGQHAVAGAQSPGRVRCCQSGQQARAFGKR